MLFSSRFTCHQVGGESVILQLRYCRSHKNLQFNPNTNVIGEHWRIASKILCRFIWLGFRWHFRFEWVHGPLEKTKYHIRCLREAFSVLLRCRSVGEALLKKKHHTGTQQTKEFYIILSPTRLQRASTKGKERGRVIGSPKRLRGRGRRGRVRRH